MPTNSGIDERDAWPPLEEDIVAARRGDVAALGRVLGAGHPRLVSFYYGVGLPHDLVGEIVSEALEAMVKGIPKLREPAAFEAWFWAIARNRMRTALRRYRSRKEPRDALISPSTPEEATIIKEEHRNIRQAMAELSQKDRELLWLHDVEGLAYGELAMRLGATEGTVRVSVHRARRRLEAAFQRLEGQ